MSFRDRLWVGVVLTYLVGAELFYIATGKKKVRW